MKKVKPRGLLTFWVPWLFGVVFLLSTTIFPGSAFSETPLSLRNQHVKWLLGKHKNLTETNHPLVSNAHAVFDRVGAAADKRSNRPPKLLMIAQADDPWAMSLSDGSVILTQKGLEICYYGVDESTGNARLAFVLGHELAHLANDDYWNWTAFEAVRRHGSQKEAVREVLDLLTKTTDAANTKQARKIRKKKELHADAYGLLYASMAGYDPMAVVDNKGKNFFREWVEQITGKIAYHDDLHPAPEQRAAFLLAYMESIKPHILLFDFGVRLYQIGLYTEALDFFKTFKNKFPCREVDNNIGLIHYQRAVNALAEFDKERAYQFKLSTVLDTRTRAANFRGRDDSKTVFRREIRKAVRHFEAACEKDPFYIPSRVNMSSALIMEEDCHGAMKVLEEAAKIKANDPRVLNNRAVATHCVGVKMGFDATRKAVETLQIIPRDHPAFRDAHFNMGRFLMLDGKTKDAENAWAMYVRTGNDDDDVFVRIIKNAITIKNIVTNDLPSEYPVVSQVRPGPLTEAVKQRFENFARYPIELETTMGAMFINGNTRALVLEDYVKIVERRVDGGKVKHAELPDGGDSCHWESNVSGSVSIYYRNSILDVERGVLTRVIYF